jgi:outer membrane protein OmpA-like peptidoglycan-associated protein
MLVAALGLPASGMLFAPAAAAQDANIVVTGERLPDPAEMTAGPDIKGVITARNAEKIKVTLADGSSQIIAISETTRIRSGGGLFGGGGNLTPESLLNGLPVTVKTWTWTGGLVANQITFKNSDLRTATMIRNGTNQRFEEQAAATEALRSRMGDIDKYNIKNTTNVYFDTGKAVLSASAKAELCATAAQAEAMENALMLVVGYTDSTGGDDINQRLSDRRASSVINFLQQACHWKPYRMLTPTGMASADPLADNTTAAGRAQNRRVSVNILVSKSIDGM